MPANPRVTKAFRAMKSLGIPEGKVKPVLKNLLKLYEKNWELIEEENYRALADAIFESEDAQVAEQKKQPEEEVHKEAEVEEEPERPLKRLRLRYQDGQASTSLSKSKSNVAGTSLIKPKEEPNELPDTCQQIQNDSQAIIELPQARAGTSMVESHLVASHPRGRNKGKEPASPKSLPLHERSDVCQLGSVDTSQPSPPRKNNANSTSSHLTCLRDRGKEPLIPSKVSGEKRSGSQKTSQVAQLNESISLLSPEEKLPGSQALMKPKEEPFTGDLTQFDVPLMVIHPELSNNGSLIGNDSGRELDGPEPSGPRAVGGKDTNDGVPASSSETRANGELVKDPGAYLELASTPCGMVKIILNYDLVYERPDFHVPSVDALLEMVKDKCLRAYKMSCPSFSASQIMNDMCKSFLELGTGSTLNGLVNTELDAEVSFPGILLLPPPCGTGDSLQPARSVSGDNRENDEENIQDTVQQTDSHSSAKRCHPNPEGIGSLIDVTDIAKGQERVVVSLMNEVNNERPPSFHYIPQNSLFQNAYVSFSLARIGDNNCCSTCNGDCLSLSTPCACAHEMGGEFAYTKEGLVKEEFLKECVSMNRNPEKHCQFVCKECPLERSKNDDTVEPCKGHLVRKFIKECWLKCGCNKQCGNRVVQRGITRRLQVFMTAGGKGWGLRTLEDLPKGAFVCEYVGEVLTNAELFDRVSRSPKGEQHSYPVLLDADWGSEGVLKDEEALCLDATYYGNVARFINHRCFDSNLVEIPVEVETPDHHYYHLAFFTTRKVRAMEELTWDYGIDFDDIDHPVKAFRCQCGSRYCRNIKRTSRSRYASRR